MNPSKDIEFWSSILSSFEGAHTSFLCVASNEFRHWWSDESFYTDSMNLVDKFVAENKVEIPAHDNELLFNSSSRQLRIKFLNWVIKHLRQ